MLSAKLLLTCLLFIPGFLYCFENEYYCILVNTTDTNNTTLSILTFFFYDSYVIAIMIMTVVFLAGTLNPKPESLKPKPWTPKPKT